MKGRRKEARKMGFLHAEKTSGEAKVGKKRKKTRKKKQDKEDEIRKTLTDVTEGTKVKSSTARERVGRLPSGC